MFTDLRDLEDSFIVLNANRPDKRKRVDLTIEGFAAFAADKPANVRLCLHHAIMGEPEKNQIRALVERCALQERLYLNPLTGGVVDDDALNLLYNACDVGITTSMGEGYPRVPTPVKKNARTFTWMYSRLGSRVIRPLRTATRRSWQPGGFGDSCLPDGIFHGALDYRFVEVMPTPDAVSRSM